jgi:hypothetical protein
MGIVHFLPSLSLYDGDDKVAGNGNVAPSNGRRLPINCLWNGHGQDPGRGGVRSKSRHVEAPFPVTVVLISTNYEMIRCGGLAARRE